MNYCNLSPLSKDERSIIYQKLHSVDWEIVRVAHNSTYEPMIDIRYIVQNGYLDIIKWMNTNLVNYNLRNYENL